MRQLNWVLWWLASIVWSVLFLIAFVHILVREVDGSGAVQTPSIRIVSLIVLLFAFTIPLAIQVIWLLVTLVKERQ